MLLQHGRIAVAFVSDVDGVYQHELESWFSFLRRADASQTTAIFCVAFTCLGFPPAQIHLVSFEQLRCLASLCFFLFRANFLGHGGLMASAFGALTNDIWTSDKASIRPCDFKAQVDHSRSHLHSCLSPIDGVRARLACGCTAKSANCFAENPVAFTTLRASPAFPRWHACLHHALLCIHLDAFLRARGQQ